MFVIESLLMPGMYFSLEGWWVNSISEATKFRDREYARNLGIRVFGMSNFVIVSVE